MRIDSPGEFDNIGLRPATVLENIIDVVLTERIAEAAVTADAFRAAESRDFVGNVEFEILPRGARDNGVAQQLDPGFSVPVRCPPSRSRRQKTRISLSTSPISAPTSAVLMKFLRHSSIMSHRREAFSRWEMIRAQSGTGNWPARSATVRRKHWHSPIPSGRRQDAASLQQ